MTSNSSWPLRPGLHTCYNGAYKEATSLEQADRARRSPDWSLQLDSMKSESLVIVDLECHGEYVPGPCTHARHTMGVVAKEVGSLTFRRVLTTL